MFLKDLKASCRAFMKIAIRVSRRAHHFSASEQISHTLLEACLDAIDLEKIAISDMESVKRDAFAKSNIAHILEP